MSTTLVTTSVCAIPPPNTIIPLVVDDDATIYREELNELELHKPLEIL